MQCAYCSQRALRDVKCIRISCKLSCTSTCRTSQVTLLYKVVGQIYSIVFKWNLFLSLHASPCTLYCMLHKEIEKLSYPGSQTILTSSLWSLVFLHTAIDQRLEVGMYWEQGWSWASYHETISQHVTRDCSINILFSEKYICTQLEMQDLSAGVWLYPY